MCASRAAPFHQSRTFPVPSSRLASIHRVDPRRSPRLAAVSVPRRADRSARGDGRTRRRQRGSATDTELRRALGLTAATATAATLLGVLGGTPIAFVIERWRFRGRAVVAALLDLPLLIPHPVAGIALLLVLGRDSIVGGAALSLGLRIVGSPAGIVVRNAVRVGAALPERCARSVRPRRPTLRGSRSHARRSAMARLPSRHAAALGTRARRRRRRHVGARRERVRRDRHHHLQSEDRERPELRPIHELRSARSVAGRGHSDRARAASAHGASRAALRSATRAGRRGAPG